MKDQKQETYNIELYIRREGANYTSDVFESLVVNDEEIIFSEYDLQWSSALRDWLNSEFDLGTRARSMQSFENALRDRGYLLTFIEQSYEADQIILRKYKISKLPSDVEDFESRRNIILHASKIIEIAAALNSPKDLESILRCCQQIVNLVPIYEGDEIEDRRPVIDYSKENLILKAGDRVYHDKFGAGSVVSRQVIGEYESIYVKFDASNLKELDPKFAKLVLLKTPNGDVTISGEQR